MDQETRCQFIAVFDQFPALWDKSCKDFGLFQRKIDFRNQLWAEVERKLAARDITVSNKGLRQAWVQIRNDFIRYKFPQQSGKNMEDCLHESLNSMSQQLFKEDTGSETLDLSSFKSTGFSASTLPIAATKWIPNNPSFGTSNPETVARQFEESAYPCAQHEQLVPSAGMEKTPTPLGNFVSFLSADSVSTFAETAAAPAPVEIRQLMSVECQTEPELLRKTGGTKEMPSLEELSSLRITFSSKRQGRQVTREVPDVDMTCTQYDEVATQETWPSSFLDSTYKSNADSQFDSIATYDPTAQPKGYILHSL